MRFGLAFWTVYGVVWLVIGVFSLVDRDWLELTATAFMLMASARGVYVARKT